MQRRGESGQPVKGRPKVRKEPTAHLSTDHSPEQFDRLKHERDEAFEQLAATSEVLHIIGSSSGQLKLVFRTMLEKATTVCEATFGNMYLRKGDVFELAATYNSPPALVEERARAPYILKAGSAPDRMVRTKSVVHIVDLASSEFYLSREPRAVAGVELGGVRTLLVVPMLKDAEVVGHFSIFRQEVRPFTDKQIELVKNFAAQAVIAIENTRLLGDLRQRTDDLSESLEQQTATSEVLSVISGSVIDAQPVFEIIAKSAARLCNAQFCHVFRFDGQLIHLAATHGYTGEALDASRRMYPIPPSRDSAAARAILSSVVEQIPDVQADPEYTHGGGSQGHEFPQHCGCADVAGWPPHWGDRRIETRGRLFPRTSN